MPRSLVIAGAAVLALLTACAPAQVIDRGRIDAREVTLTFDTAYDTQYTAAVLDVLDDFDVDATMFVTGEWAEANPELLRRMVAEGHLVGNHSYSHPDMTTVSDAAVTSQLRRAEDAIVSRTNRSTKPYFRPPYGAQNAHLNQLLGNEGFRFDVLWTVDSVDWQPNVTLEQLVRRVLTAARPGAIILLHDGGGDRSATVAALPTIITGLRRLGLTLTVLPT